MGQLIKIVKSKDELADFFASFLVKQINETPGDQYFSWVLSGGSTPKMIFEKIAICYKDLIDWKKVAIFWGDERCVGPEDAESNYKMARESLLDLVPVPSSNIFRIQGESVPADEAGRYADQFLKNVNTVHGFPRADLLMLGLGEDGHTASIFPSNIQLFSSNKLFETAEHPQTKQKRITATGKIINHAKMVVVVATGENKSSVVARIVNKSNGCDLLPASFIRPEHGEVLWLLDQEAAKKL